MGSSPVAVTKTFTHWEWIETSDSSYFCGKNYFEDDGIKNWLVLQLIYKYFKITTTTNIILLLKSKVLPDEKIKLLKPHTVRAPELSYVGSKTKVKFNGSCLIQNKIIFYHKQ